METRSDTDIRLDVEFTARYMAARARRERIDAMIYNRMYRLTAEAGLDPSLLGIHPHNAMCAYRDGRPWPGVDYAKVRKVLWLEKRRYHPYRILADYYTRMTKAGRRLIP